MNRLDFLKRSASLGLAMAMAPNMSIAEVLKRNVRLGFIGVGLRGRNHLNLALRRSDTDVIAICDIDPAALKTSQDMIAKAGKKAAVEYSKGEYAFRDLLKRDDIDGVIISTPWTWHTFMAVESMRAGKYTGVEVSAANTLEECWDLVNTYEETGAPCMILENVCYRRDMMAVLNMARKGVFGEMIHARCGYQHDLREVKFNNGKQPYGGGVEFGEKGFSEAKWRTQHSVKRNADLYPTHGVGPIANILNINRGNRFIQLHSMATKSRGLHDYIVNHPEGGENHPNAKVRFKLGDIVTTQIATSNGETIIVTHDTNLPRPYSLGFRVQGVKGLWEKPQYYNGMLHVEGLSPKHQWEEDTTYMEQYDHPLWKKYGKDAEGAGHGGMDFFVIHAFVESIKRGVEPPLDVYDAAAWSAVTPLSEESIAQGGALVEFPDFTRAKWIKRKPIFAFNDQF